MKIVLAVSVKLAHVPITHHMKKKPLRLEVNAKAINDTGRTLEGIGVLITPPIGKNFWLFRVKLSKEQAILGFPKFGSIGVGFAQEEDWNSNLPSGTETDEIFSHIRHNKGDKTIPDERCKDAIRLVQSAVLKMNCAETKNQLVLAKTDTDKLRALSWFLRHTGNHEVAARFDQTL